LDCGALATETNLIEDLASYTFISAPSMEDGVKHFAAEVWSQLKSKRYTRALWVGRIVTLFPNSSRKVLQPGYIFYDRNADLLGCEWLRCKGESFHIPYHSQYEFVQGNVPLVDDSYMHHPSYIFSETLWSSGVIRPIANPLHKILNSPIKLKQPAPKPKRKNVVTEPLPSPSPNDQPGTEQLKSEQPNPK